MKLYDLLNVIEGDWDCYDETFDECVTCCYIEENKAEDDYDRFCIEIMKKVDVLKKVSDCTLVCDQTKLIKNNLEVFKAFTRKYWVHDYEDIDRFYCEQIAELNAYMAGEVGDSFYKVLCDELLSKLVQAKILGLSDFILSVKQFIESQIKIDQSVLNEFIIGIRAYKEYQLNNNQK